MNLDELDGRIGEGWGGDGPERQPRQRRARHAAAAPTAAAARRRCSRSPRPATRRCSCCVGPEQAEYEPIWPPTLMMNKATAHDRPPPDDHVGRGAARDRPGRARRGRRRAARGDRRPDRARRRLGRRAAPTTRPPSAQANRAAVRKAIGICVDGRDPDRSGAARRRARHAARTRSTAASDADQPRSRRGATRSRSTRRSAPRGIRSRAAHQEATLVDRPLRRRHSTGCASGDHLPDRASCSSVPRRASIRCRTEVVREVVRDGRLPRRPHRGRRGRGLGSRRHARSGSPCWQLLGGRSERLLAYASSGELVDPEERARRCVALRDAGVRAVQDPLPPRRLARRRRRSSQAVRDAVGSDFEIMVDANQGWRMPGRPRAVAGMSRPRRSVARALEPPRRLLARGAAAH